MGWRLRIRKGPLRYDLVALHLGARRQIAVSAWPACGALGHPNGGHNILIFAMGFRHLSPFPRRSNIWRDDGPVPLARSDEVATGCTIVKRRTQGLAVECRVQLKSDPKRAKMNVSRTAGKISTGTMTAYRNNSRHGFYKPLSLFSKAPIPILCRGHVPFLRLLLGAASVFRSQIDPLR